MEAKLSGPWSMAQVRDHLDHAVIPMRLACLGPGGHPLVASLWYVHRAEALWCASRAAADLVGFLREDPRCGFEVAADAPPYLGVRGWGKATLDPERGEEILRALVDRYLGTNGRESSLGRWLLSRGESEVAIRIDPVRLVSWDYSERMD